MTRIFLADFTKGVFQQPLAISIIGAYRAQGAVGRYAHNLERLRESRFQEPTQFGSRLIPRNRVQFLEDLYRKFRCACLESCFVRKGPISRGDFATLLQV